MLFRSLVFAFALVREGEAPADGAAGILWIAISFAGTLALGRTFERERQAETLRALLMAPASRAAIYLGKLLGIIALLLGAEVVLVPLVAFLFVWAMRYPLRVGLTVGVALSQIGEFSFILANLGLSLELLTPRGHALVMAGAILSILLNPLLFKLALRQIGRAHV